MFAERLFAGLGRDVARVGFFADELLFNRDVTLGLERLGVAREVAVGHAEQFLERIEIGRIVDHEHTHDPEPNPVVERLIDILNNILQLSIVNYSLLIVSVVLEIHDAAVNNMADAESDRPKLERITRHSGGNES